MRVYLLEAAASEEALKATLQGVAFICRAQRIQSYARIYLQWLSPSECRVGCLDHFSNWFRIGGKRLDFGANCGLIPTHTQSPHSADAESERHKREHTEVCELHREHRPVTHSTPLVTPGIYLKYCMKS